MCVEQSLRDSFLFGGGSFPWLQKLSEYTYVTWPEAFCNDIQRPYFADRSQEVALIVRIPPTNIMAKPSVYVITGASRGLGLELTKQVSLVMSGYFHLDIFLPLSRTQ